MPVHPEAHTPFEAGVETRRRSAFETTMSDFSRVLGLADPIIERPRSHSTAMDDALRRIENSVAMATEAFDTAYVQAMLHEPYRITAAVYGPRATAIWPVLGKTTAQVLEDCRVARENLHWSQPASRKHALRQAERALKVLVAEEERGDG